MNSLFGEFELDLGPPEGDPTLGFHGEFGNRYSLRSSDPEWLRSVVHALGRLIELNDNWDTYGAKRVNLRSISYAAQIACLLARVDTISEPSVTATPEGDVAFVWDDGNTSLDLEVGPDGLMSFVFLDETDDKNSCSDRTREIEDVIRLLTTF